ncbi:MAG: hypothetical protein HQL21_03615 [Candidatus Omnitrophica bacterium]|nr:hypothetical protein [Candidatus Omnitrophota bacterium]
MFGSRQQGSLRDLRQWTWFRVLCLTVLVSYCCDFIGIDFLRVQEARAQSMVMAPLPGTLLSISSATALPSLKAISIDPADPLKINFLVDGGDQAKVNEEESRLLIKYFLTFLTIPEQDLWVNLSPSEPGRIINPDLGRTTVGRDMLMEDYLLKQLAASMTFPEREPGKTFWEQIYSKIKKQYGDVDLPLNTFSKVWIVPEKAVVYEQKDAAFISESRLKVMLDEDYLTMKKSALVDKSFAGSVDQASELYLKIAREIIIPALEREVNEGQYFAPLRQMVNSLILAIWFKRKLQDHVVNQVYTNQKKTSGIQIEDKQISQKIYEQYMLALQKGVYNVIREEEDPDQQAVVPRHYFSGGVVLESAMAAIEFKPMPSFKPEQASLIRRLGDKLSRFTISLLPRGMSRQALLNLVLAAGLLTGVGSKALAQTMPAPTPLPQAAVTTVSPSKAPLSPIYGAPQNIQLKAPPSIAPVKVTSAPSAIKGGQVISAEAVVVEDMVLMRAPSGGVVRQFDLGKKEYAKDENIYFIEDSKVVEKIVAKSAQLKIRTDMLTSTDWAAGATGPEFSKTMIEAANLEVEIQGLEAQRIVGVVKAPCDLSIPDREGVHDGMTVVAGQRLTDYIPKDRGHLQVSIPLEQTYFGRIHKFRVGDKELEPTGAVLQLDPTHTQLLVTFSVYGPDGLPDIGKKHAVVIEIIPPLEDKNGLDKVHSVSSTWVAVDQNASSLEIRTPSVGPVQFNVQPGDRVQVDDWILTQKGPALDEFGKTMSELQEVQKQLKNVQSSGGLMGVSPDEVLHLRDREAELSARLKTLQDEAGRLLVKTPADGMVKEISWEPSSFDQGAVAVRLQRSQFVIGNTDNSILFSRDLQISEGDPVVLRTPAGIYGVGEVIKTDPGVQSSKSNLGPVQAVKIKVYDPHNAFYAGLPLQVIVPDSSERARVAQVLAKVKATRLESSRSATAMNPLAHVTIPSSVAMGGSTVGTVASKQIVPLPIPDVSGARYTKAEIVEKVRANSLGYFAARTSLAQSQSLTGKARQGQDLSIGIDPSTSLSVDSVNVGASGEVSAGFPNPFKLVFGFVESLFRKGADHKDHGPEKRAAVIKAIQDAAQHHVDAEKDRLEQVSLEYAAVIGQAQMRQSQLRPFLQLLQEQKKALEARREAGLAQSNALTELDSQITAKRLEMQYWKNQEQTATLALHRMMGSESKEPIVPEFPWNGTFPGTSAAEEATLKGRLGSNAQLLQAQAANRLMDILAEIYGKNTVFARPDLKWILDVASMHSNLTSPMSKVPSPRSFVNPGGMGVTFRMDDPKSEVAKLVTADERGFSSNNLVNVNLELEQRQATASAWKQSLSERIQQAEKEYSRVVATQEQMDAQQAASKNYSPGQMVAAHAAVDRAAADLTDLEAQYFKMEAALCGLDVLRSDQTYVGAAANSATIRKAQAVVAASVSGLNTVSVTASQGKGQGSSGLTVSFPTPSSPPRDSFAVGDVLISAPGISPIELGTMMTGKEPFSQKQYDVAVRVLTQDANVMNRVEMLDFFLKTLQSNHKGIDTVEQIILNSPWDDVRQRLLQHMVNLDGFDARFLVYIADQAIDPKDPQKKNPVLGELCLHTFNDILVNDPNALKQLSELNYSPETGPAHARISVDTARRFLLTFLSWAPENSLGRIRLLQSDYWTVEQLAQIYKTLRSGNQGGSERLSQLIYDEILRREVLANLEEFFHKGPFRQLPIYISSDDVYGAFMSEEFKKVNQLFLTSSPEWRDIEGRVPEQLYQRGKAGADTLVGPTGPSLLGPGPMVYDVSPVSMTDTSLLAYYGNLDDTARKAHITDLKRPPSLPELARILKADRNLRGMALDKLMETQQGRILVLSAYTEVDEAKAGNDEAKADARDLCNLVEGREWNDRLLTDVKDVSDPVSTDIVRRAMEKMSRRTGQTWPSNFRGRTYSFDELKTATDLQPGDKDLRLQALAVEQALGLLREAGRNSPRLWLGQVVYNPQELNLMQQVQKIIDSSGDPRVLISYLDQLDKENDPTTKVLRKDLTYWRNRTAKAIEDNNQDLPRAPFFTWAFSSALALIIAGLFGRKLLWKAHINSSSTRSLLDKYDMEVMPKSDNEGGTHESAMANQNGESGKKRFFSMLFNRRASKKAKLLSIPSIEMPGKTLQHLKIWESVLLRWKKDGIQVDPKSVVIDLNNIMNNASEILREIPYDPGLMGRPHVGGSIENERYHSVLINFNSLALNTMKVLEDYLENRSDLDPVQKKAFLRDVGDLINMAKYSARYTKILRSRGIIDMVMAYKFANSHLFEWSGIYPFMRFCSGYGFLLGGSRKGIRNELPQLLENSESFLPGLYGNADNKKKIIKESEQTLGESIQNADTLLSPIGTKDAYMLKVRRLRSRLWLFVPFLCNIGLFALALTGVFPLFVTQLSILGLVFFIGKIITFWLPHLRLMQMPWKVIFDLAIKKFDSSLSEKLGMPSGSTIGGAQGSGEKNIVRLAIEEGALALKKELDPTRKASVDMIMVLPEDPGDEEGVRGFVKDSQGQGELFRKDTPVVVAPATRKGSANVYFDAIQVVQDKLNDEQFLRENPHLRGVPWQDVKVLFVFHGANQGQDKSSLKWAVINGYRAMGASNGQKQGQVGTEPGGHTVIYSRDVYFGPMLNFPDKDINILGDWVDQEALKNLGLMIMDFAKDGITVQEILEKLDIAERQEKEKQRGATNNTLTRLKRDYSYDLGNNSIRQYPAATGVMRFSPKTVRILGRVHQDLKDNKSLRQKLGYLHLTTDVLNNLIKQPEDLGDDRYLDTRVGFSDIKENYKITNRDDARAIFRPLYELFAKAREAEGNHLTINSVLPHRGAGEVIHVKRPKDMERVIELLREGGLGDIISWRPAQEPLPQTSVVLQPSLAAQDGSGNPALGEGSASKETQPPSTDKSIVLSQEQKDQETIPQRTKEPSKTVVEPILRSVEGTADARQSVSEPKSLAEDTVFAVGKRTSVPISLATIRKAWYPVLLFAHAFSSNKASVPVQQILNKFLTGKGLDGQDLQGSLDQFFKDYEVAEEDQVPNWQDFVSGLTIDGLRDLVDTVTDEIRRRKDSPDQQWLPILEYLRTRIQDVAPAVSVPAGLSQKASHSSSVDTQLPQEYLRYTKQVGRLTQEAERLRGPKGSKMSWVNRKLRASVNGEIFALTGELARKVIADEQLSQSDPVLAGATQKYLKYKHEVDALKERIAALGGEDGATLSESKKKQIRSLYGQISAIKNFRMTPLRTQILPRLETVIQAAEPAMEKDLKNGGLDLSGMKNNIEFREGDSLLIKNLQPFVLAHPLRFLSLLRGFDFNIIAFQPIEDPAKFFAF